MTRPLTIAALALAASCSQSPTTAPPSVAAPANPIVPPTPPVRVDTSYDVATLGVPPVIQAHYIDLSRISAVSRFRSGVGHDYSDDAERCRSMKHYFRPTPGTDWSTVRIVAPVTGRVTRVIEEWAGVQLQIRSSAQPAFTIVLFHVAPARTIGVGDSVSAGDALGTHVGTQTTSDVAVWVALPGQKRGLVSYVDALPVALRGQLPPRDSLVISRAQRDAAPLACDGEAFVGADALAQWVSVQR